ncbi:MAG: sulfatase [Limisphaerales bacterium]
MTLRSSILAVVSGVLLAGFVGRAEGRPNFVVFIADDVSWNDLGCYGNKGARTPHIDRLAGQGLLFRNAYLTASSCSPSRASIMTGRYPHNTGEASELHRPWSAHLPTFPELLREGGYHTALAGKFHMAQKKEGNEETRLSRAFDRVEPNVRVPGNSGGHGRWVDVVRERPRGKPFFFWFASTDAHRGWDADAEWDAKEYGPRHRPEDMVVPPELADSEDTHKDLASYHNEVTRFDHFIGRTVSELKKAGVLDNTVILVMADNGRPFPRGKTRLHDAGMKTPFVVHWPDGIRQGGQERLALISAIDIAPTILELAGVRAAETLQGVSFVPVLESDRQVRRYAFSEHNWHDYEAHGRSLRDQAGHLYIRNARPAKAWIGPSDSVGSPAHRDLKKRREGGSLTPVQADLFLEPRPPEELYFTPDDPAQVANRVGDPSFDARLREMRGLMDRWQRETGDSVPSDFTPDYYDRETGYIDSRSGRPVAELRKRDYRVPPGAEHNADKLNASGPK